MDDSISLVRVSGKGLTFQGKENINMIYLA